MSPPPSTGPPHPHSSPLRTHIMPSLDSFQSVSPWNSAPATLIVPELRPGAPELGRVDPQKAPLTGKSPVPHNSRITVRRSPTSLPAQRCHSPNAEVRLLFFFLRLFFADSGASASSRSSSGSPPLTSCGSASRRGCSSAMIGDLEMK